jgi:hypothetical protein
MRHELMNLLLGHSNILWRVSCDEYLFRITSLGTSRAISIDLRERGRKVDCCVSCRLDELDVLSRSSAYDCVKRELEDRSINNASQLTDC